MSKPQQQQKDAAQKGKYKLSMQEIEELEAQQYELDKQQSLEREDQKKRSL